MTATIQYFKQPQKNCMPKVSTALKQTPGSSDVHVCFAHHKSNVPVLWQQKVKSFSVKLVTCSGGECEKETHDVNQGNLWEPVKSNPVTAR